MDIEDALMDIEEELIKSHDVKVIKLCEKYFPEENFGEFTDNGMIDDMFNVIISEAGSNKESAKDIYYFLLDEKISIDEDDFYNEEEINHG
jgi:hypothetical protein